MGTQRPDASTAHGPKDHATGSAGPDRMERIGKYEIVDVLGQGGMGVVYRARDPRLNRDVAIKVILDRAIDAPQIRERFYREARSAGALSHENVTTIFDVGDEDGKPYLVMELLDGTDLRAVLETSPPLVTRLDLAVQVCMGLGYAHSRGIVHRDVKPENVRVTSTGRAKILDFGIARIQSEEQTMTQASLGTPRYMSPEQIRGGAVDHRTDIFSFGVLFYELLTGISPFAGEHITSVIYKVLNHEPDPIRLADPVAQRDLQAVVSKCLAKVAAKRYSTFQEVIEGIRQVRVSPEGAAPAAKPKTSLFSRLWGTSEPDAAAPPALTGATMPWTEARTRQATPPAAPPPVAPPPVAPPAAPPTAPVSPVREDEPAEDDFTRVIPAALVRDAPDPAAERAESERIEAEQADAARLEAARVAAEQAEAARIEAEQAEARRVEAARLEAARLAAEQAEAERVEAERLEAARIEAARIEAEQLEAAQAEAAKEAAERAAADAARIAAEQAEAEKAEAERIEAERIEAERIEAARVEAERLEAERAAAEKAEAERAEAVAAEAARLEAETARVEAERIAAEQAKADERAEAERAASAAAESARVEAARIEAQQAEARRIETARIEAEKAEAEREAAVAEAARVEAEKAELTRIEAERIEAERIEAEQAETERVAAEKAEADWLAAEQAEGERREAEAAHAEAARLEAERLSAEAQAADRAALDVTSVLPVAAALAAAPADPPAPDALDVTRTLDPQARAAAEASPEPNATVALPPPVALPKPGVSAPPKPPRAPGKNRGRPAESPAPRPPAPSPRRSDPAPVIPTPPPAEGDIDEARSNRLWILGGGLAVVLLAVAVFVLRSRNEEPPVEAAGVEQGPDDAADDPLRQLETAARTARDQMVAQRDSAAAAGVTGSPGFQQATTRAAEAEAALAQGDEAGYQLAAQAAQDAAGLFANARLTATASADELRRLVGRAEQDAQAARGLVAGSRGNAAVAPLFASAERALTAGAQARAAGNDADAVRRFTEAQQGFQAARRALDQSAARAEADRPLPAATQPDTPSAPSAEEVSARRAADAVAATKARVPAANRTTEAYARATRSETAATRALGQRNFEAAQRQYLLAARQYDEAARATAAAPPPPSTAAADNARTRATAAAAAKARVPASNRSTEAYTEAVRSETAAAAALQRADYPAAVRQYDLAVRRFGEAAAARPAPPPPEYTRPDPPPAGNTAGASAAAGSLASALARAVEQEDLGAARGVHSFYGSLSRVFQTAERITATATATNVQADGAQTTADVSLTLNITQLNGNVSVQRLRYRWTMAQSGGEWRLTDVRSL